MRILAMDTSSSATGLALYEEPAPMKGQGILEAQMVVNHDRQQAEALLPMAEALLQSAGRRKEEIDAYACTLGPGSFTGLRIGVTIAKTLAQFTHKPLVGISTLQALAKSAETPPAYLRATILDARANRIFAALWDEAGAKCLLAEGLYYEEDFLAAIGPLLEAQGARGLAWMGAGLTAHPHLLEGTPLPYEWVRGEAQQSPVEAVARLAAVRLEQGPGDDVLDLKPHYLRKSQAELDRGCAHARK